MERDQDRARPMGDTGRFAWRTTIALLWGHIFGTLPVHSVNRWA